jgi:hypothetical protein
LTGADVAATVTAIAAAMICKAFIFFIFFILLCLHRLFLNAF